MPHRHYRHRAIGALRIKLGRLPERCRCNKKWDRSLHLYFRSAAARYAKYEEMYSHIAKLTDKTMPRTALLLATYFVFRRIINNFRALSARL
eukprot:6183078-Pleurochrysis_carterae.AAC.2